MGGFLAACRDCYKDWLNRLPENLEASLVNDWARVPDDIAFVAGIDPDEERRLEVKQLIRRHAEDLRWANPELRAKAIAELTRYGKEFPGIPELALALLPLERTMAKTAYPAADRAAAAEALGHIGGPRAAEALLLRIRSGEESAVALRRAAAEALGLLDASADNPEAHWDLLQEILADGGQHLHGETDPARIEAKLPLLQGASRGLQRLAARSRPFRLPVWGSGRGLKVPMLTLTTAAGAVTTRLVAVEVWQVPLPGGLPLEVVEIQGGTFPIGSPRGELGRDAYGYAPEAAGIEVEAQRLVTVPTFAMARFPITQAQWQTLAEANPSQHKGADLPVACVSWHDSQSWLKRLNRWLAEQGPAQGLAGEPPRLALPSENLWEVACRGGSASPFHFGDTLDAAWANYDASPNYVYPGGRAGRYLQRPSPVGSYGLVNERGLADLHGNVWECCEDVWHPSPLGGPLDGRPRHEPVAGVWDMRLLRGGSWFITPQNCRSAYRSRLRPADSNSVVGFRVCCLPPGFPSWPLYP
jgi:formylglycine-generating enzyme required for sulfatase activity